MSRISVVNGFLTLNMPRDSVQELGARRLLNISGLSSLLPHPTSSDGKNVPTLLPIPLKSPSVYQGLHLALAGSHPSLAVDRVLQGYGVGAVS